MKMGIYTTSAHYVH